MGDKFVSQSFDQHLKEVKNNGEYATYAFMNFEVRDFSSSRFQSHNKSTLGRLINNLIRGLNEHSTIPVCIVMVLDDNPIADLPSEGFEIVAEDLT